MPEIAYGHCLHVLYSFTFPSTFQLYGAVKKYPTSAVAAGFSAFAALASVTSMSTRIPSGPSSVGSDVAAFSLPKDQKLRLTKAVE